jgi:hypothetical protein
MFTAVNTKVTALWDITLSIQYTGPSILEQPVADYLQQRNTSYIPEDCDFHVALKHFFLIIGLIIDANITA